MPFKQNYIYPLKDPERYNDDFGYEYDHALLADYGPIAPDCWVHDAWIVKANGEVHPGLSESPVPVRLEDVEDVEETKGRYFQPVGA